MGGDDAGGTARSRSRAVAVTAFLVLGTGALLPWWRIAYRTTEGHVYARLAVRLFEEAGFYAHHAATIASGILVVAALLWLFVRLAARSDRYEPARYRRDLAGIAILAGVATLSAFAWPQDVPDFWGGRHIDEAGVEFDEVTQPGVGWFLALLAALLCGLAWWLEARFQAGSQATVAATPANPEEPGASDEASPPPARPPA